VKFRSTIICSVFLLPLAACYSSTNVVFSDGFESGMGNWTQVWAGSPAMVAVTSGTGGEITSAYEGTYMATGAVVCDWYRSVMAHDLAEPLAKATVTFMVAWTSGIDFGPDPSSKTAYVEVYKSGSFALFGNIYNAATNRNDLLGWRVHDDNGDTGWVSTSIQLHRHSEAGWYEARFVTDSTGIKGYWNGLLMFSSNGDFTVVSGLDFGTNESSDPVSGRGGSGMYYDDITVVSETTPCEDVWNAGQGMPADMDRNCVVDWDDLMILLSEWLY
jgi:hypothetical protein